MDPILKRVTVELEQRRAFDLYTAGIATWWPLSSHSVGGEDAESCAFETKAGGRIFEIGADGSEVTWGTVLAYEPHRRLLFTWHPGRTAESAQEVEVRFRAAKDRTEIELEHRDWQNLGDRAEEMYRGYDTGWDYVLGECYRRAAQQSAGQ